MALFFHYFLNQFQMKNNHISLAIILQKTQNGFAFHSLQQLQPNQDKSKKPKPGRKPLQKGIPNRLIKQIGLTNQHLAPQITPLPQPQNVLPLDEEQHQNIPIFHPAPQDEQISCEVDRQTDLPKSPAIWFDKQSIHQIQKRQLKEFFLPSQTIKSQLYIKYRNFIVDSYLKNPRRYLSKIACRRILRGDVNTIMRIHDFLEKHGIINFSLNYDGSHTFRANSLNKHYEQKIKPQTFLKYPPEQDEQTAQKQIDTDNMTITVINKNFSRTYRACCTECKLICGIVWFANVTQQQSAHQKNLCFECWSNKNENQKSQYIKVDIVKKMEAHNRDAKNFPKNAWNIEENIRLLDFMSNSEKSWKKLLDEFGGKRTIEDIVLQFLQFPISNVEINECKKKQNQQMKNSQDNGQSTRYPQENGQNIGYLQDNGQDIGYSSADYNKLLKEFYLGGNLYLKKDCGKMLSNGTSQIREIKDQKDPFTSSTIDNQKSEQIKQILALTIEQIQTKLQGLKEKQYLVYEQSNSFDCFNSYKNKQIKLSTEEEIVSNQSAQIENKSRTVKGSQQQRNQNPQIIDEQEPQN